MIQAPSTGKAFRFSFQTVTHLGISGLALREERWNLHQVT